MTDALAAVDRPKAAAAANRSFFTVSSPAAPSPTRFEHPRSWSPARRHDCNVIQPQQRLESKQRLSDGVKIHAGVTFQACVAPFGVTLRDLASVGRADYA